jgi:hypothetical protein
MTSSDKHPPSNAPEGNRTAELRQILEALFEERAEPEQLRRLDELVLGDAACRRFYLEYVDLHGNLYWDAAQADAEPVPLATPLPEERPDVRRVAPTKPPRGPREPAKPALDLGRARRGGDRDSVGAGQLARADGSRPGAQRQRGNY